MKKTLTIILIFILCGFTSAGIAYGVANPGDAQGDTMQSEPLPSDGDDVKQKKAIIVLHSMLVGALENADTGELLWLPVTSEGVDLNNVLHSMAASMITLLLSDPSLPVAIGKIADDDHNSVIYQMLCDENGNSIHNVQAVDFEKCENFNRYGILGAYRDMYEGLEERYGDDTEVIVYQYDWRLDNRLAAEKLENFINEKGYTDVVLISHSNGGPVASCYLGRSEANRQKVKLYCAYAAPFLGASMALTTLENVDGLMAYYREIVEQFVSDGALLDGIFTNQLRPLAQNLPILYQLLPTMDYFNTYYSSDGTQGSLVVDGTPITTQEELVEFYCSRPWATNSKGELKPMIAQWQDYVDSMYVTVNGERKHATELVNTYYFTNVGSGACDTQIVYENGKLKYYYGLEGNGDSTVLYSSATIGKNKDDERVVFSEKYISHDYYGIDWDTVEEETTSLIDEIWK